MINYRGIPSEISDKLDVFKDFVFFDDGHYYTYKDTRISISTTKLIHDYAQEFDAEKTAENVAIKNGKTTSQVLEEWRIENKFSTVKGSHCHLFAQELWNGNYYEIDYSKIDNDVDKTRLKKSFEKIKGLALSFYENYKDIFIPIADEFLVGSVDYDIAGSIDNLFLNTLTNEIIMVDYKTNKEIKYEGFKKATMKVPLNNLQDCNYIHYCIQLNVYTKLFEEATGLKIGERMIVYFNEQADDYEIIEIKDLKNEVEKILENRRVKNMNSIPVLIMGASGTGKTRSLKNLPVNETAIINVTNKPLPFRNNGLKVVHSENYDEIITSLKNTKRKIVVIDDCGYLLTFENFDKATNKGYDKFTVMAQNFYKLINTVRNLDGEKIVYLITHEEVDDDNKVKPKMIGKMLNQQLCVEGLFTIVLRSNYKNNQYVFETKTDGISVAKSPEEMFEEDDIPNDLAEVDKAIREYYGFSKLDKVEESEEK